MVQTTQHTQVDRTVARDRVTVSPVCVRCVWSVCALVPRAWNHMIVVYYSGK